MISRSKRGSATVVSVILIGFVLALMVTIPCCIGIGGFGPTNKVMGATVNRLYVDFESDGDAGGSSSYMVGTDKGVFEVDNGLLLGLWNADELYSKLQVGQTYNLVTKGNKAVNILFQSYPFIVSAEQVQAAAPVDTRVEKDSKPSAVVGLVYDLRKPDAMPLDVILPDGTKITFLPRQQASQ